MSEHHYHQVGELNKSIIRRHVRLQRAAIRTCYESGLRRNPELAGTIVASFKIEPDGTVTDSDVEGGPEGVRHCIAGVVAGIRFPAAYKSRVQTNVRYPFRFRPI